MNERISFPLNRKSVATGRNKGRNSLKVYFYEMKKLLPAEAYLRNWNKMARKSVFNSQNKVFVEKYVYTRLSRHLPVQS